MSCLSTNFVRRQKLTRSIGEFGGINTTPELTPKDNIQAYMNTMSMFGGGEVRLGPYDFLIQSEATDATDAATANFWTVPANVTLIGVPNKTIIYKKAVFGESVGNSIANLKSLGPVVSLGGDGSSIIGCTVYLDLYSNRVSGESRGGDFRDDGASGIGLQVPSVGTVAAINRKNTCTTMVVMNMTRQRLSKLQRHLKNLLKVMQQKEQKPSIKK